MKLATVVNSCTLREGIGAESKRPYRFYQLNVTVTGPDGVAIGGDLTVDQEVKPGRYTVGVQLETMKGRIQPRLAGFEPSK